MSAAWKTWVLRFAQLTLTTGVTWVVVSRVGVTLDDTLSLRPAVPDPSTPILLASIVTLFFGLTFSSWLWGRMVSELGSSSPGLIGSMRIVFSANVARYLPGRLWQLAGLAVLAGRVGVSGAVAGIAGVLGQAFSLAAVTIIAAPVFLGSRAGDGHAWAAAVGVLILFVALASVPPLVDAGLRFALRVARIPTDGPSSVARMFGLRWLGWYLLNWIAYGLAFVLLVRGLGFSVGWLELISSFSAAYLLGYIAIFAPAGLGVREGFLVVFLEPELAGAAVGVAVLTRVWMTAVELLPAAGFAIWEVARTGGRLRGQLESEEL